MKISIIIPVYNAAPYIERCLDSVLNQDINDYEVIAINDGSKDNSLEVMERYKEASPVGHRLKILTQENRGVSATRNRGIDKAQGEYITFVDADDYILENSLAGITKEISILQEKPELVIVGMYFVDNGSSPVIRRAYDYSRISGKDIHSFAEEFISLDSACSKFYCRDFLKKINARFNTKLVLYEDLLFNFSIIGKCSLILTLPIGFYFYDKHSGSASTKCQGMKLFETCHEVFNTLTGYYASHGRYETMIPKIKEHLALYMYRGIFRIYLDKNVKNRRKMLRQQWEAAPLVFDDWQMYLNGRFPNMVKKVGTRSIFLLDLMFRGAALICRIKHRVI